MIAERTARQEALLDELFRACADDPVNAEHTSDGIGQPGLRDLARMAASELLDTADADGRIPAEAAADVWNRYFNPEGKVPADGWLQHVYLYIRSVIFPHLAFPENTEEFADRRQALLIFMRGIYDYERRCCAFDPVRDIMLLDDREIMENSFTPEYLRMKQLAHDYFIYEFMRIGSEITPFNTLGHVGGVHYIAMHNARQLHAAGIPVDLGLISAAAATHDIGKYGCRKQEERRVPYLHYYYTDYCLGRNDLKGIAHIAANHSVWDLEIENLSVESLLLIYADFRSKSTREDGREIIHFYSLKEAFDVILSKLDNVDEAKRDRYTRVYSKLRDFEEYMKEHGVDPSLPDRAEVWPADYLFTYPEKTEYEEKEAALLTGSEVIDQIRYRSIDHNIRMMRRFGDPQQFGSLLEDARSETDWKNLRTYIDILRRYSTYMSDAQKSMTLRFLYDQLAHSESDIREQTATAMGLIVAKYREEYKKELPEDIPAPDDNVSNLSMFSQYIELLLHPDHKYTEMHRKWITNTTDFFVREVVKSCRPSCRHKYYDILSRYYTNDTRDEEQLIVLMYTALKAGPGLCPDSFAARVRTFARSILGMHGRDVDLVTIDVLVSYGAITEKEYEKRKRALLGLREGPVTDDELSAMFLDDLKSHVSWIAKLANISVMSSDEVRNGEGGRLLHIATHFANLIKVSETVNVRRRAGEALLEVMSELPMDQRNELMVELFNGLEIEDYQFAGIIPDYLGAVILHLRPDELDEVIDELGRMVNSGSDRIASAALSTLAVALENYSIYEYRHRDESCDARRLHILGLILKGCSYYRKAISRESLRLIGSKLFSSRILTGDEKWDIGIHSFRRLLMLLPDHADCDELEFCNNAGMLNSVYRFIAEYEHSHDEPEFPETRPAAFFPGTFDPFSLGHKAIASTIRDMGFDVYLAIDEFSWSKKTLPHILRKEIAKMSVADEEGIYLFPDNIPVNIANPEDLAYLRKCFAGRELYIAMGSDVVMNASAYRAAPEENSIHSFNHIVFEREAMKLDEEGESFPVTGKIVQLTLQKYYEDISSTRIRENIDLGRDISSLIDPVAQAYIYENNYYTRVPAYKHVLQARELNIHTYEPGTNTDDIFIASGLGGDSGKAGALTDYFSGNDVRKVIIESADHSISAAAGARRIRTSDLLEEFGDVDVASYIRSHCGGETAVIGAFYVSGGKSVSYIRQILLTELLAMLMARDYTYAVFHPVCGEAADPLAVSTMIRQGFVNISEDPEHPVYAVDMKNPVVIFRDAETVIKDPLNKNPRVQKVIDEAHDNLLEAFRNIYPGKLLVSFNTSAVYSKIVDLVAEANGVSIRPDPLRRRGPYMSVPFGKALSDVVVPNTVTKALRTEKYFNEDLRGFSIREARGYQPLDDQARTLKSFRRPVILVDDLLHSGQRMNKIDAVLRSSNVEVKKVIVGLLTGNALDNMRIRDRETSSAYFIPSISMWINERDCYPFIGGDGIDSPDADENASINMILPYTGLSFAAGGDLVNIYRYSVTCLENALHILKVLEQEYQKKFEKKLTLGRLGAVITNPRLPLLGTGLRYDEHVAPSTYVENELYRIRRLAAFRDGNGGMIP